MEASTISAARTAASAVSGCLHLRPAKRGNASVAVVGTGLISRYVVSMLRSAEYPISRVNLFDTEPSYAQAFAARIQEAGLPEVRIADSLQDAIQTSDVIVFATTAGAPHVSSAQWFEHCPLVLHLSLRDLAPEVILSAHNIVDDVDHAVKARTSLHLTEQQVGNRNFINGTLAEILCGDKVPPLSDRPIIFSPFGMGILDLAVGQFAYSALVATTDPVESFYSETQRI